MYDEALHEERHNFLALLFIVYSYVIYFFNTYNYFYLK